MATAAHRSITTWRLLAPYLAAMIFWCGVRPGWVALLAYHVQILLVSKSGLKRTVQGWDARAFRKWAIFYGLAGPAAYFLLPRIARLPMRLWLLKHGISQRSLWMLMPYFGLVHPFLEQAHWGNAREDPRLEPWAHLLYAGYHAIVLHSLLSPAWTFACVLLLFTASRGWRSMVQRPNEGLLTPTLTQILADTGLAVAAVLLSCQ